MWKLAGERTDAALSGAVDGAVVGGAAGALSVIPSAYYAFDRVNGLSAGKALGRAASPSRAASILISLLDPGVRAAVRRSGKFGIPAGMAIGAGIGALRGHSGDGAADGALSGAAVGAGTAALTTFPAVTYDFARKQMMSHAEALREVADLLRPSNAAEFIRENAPIGTILRAAPVFALPASLAVGAGIGALRRRFGEKDGEK